MDQNGHIVVVDNKLCQVFVFQLNGRLITQFGSRGTEPHQLAGPHFVAVNNDNFFYISDFYNHCVKVSRYANPFLFKFISPNVSFMCVLMVCIALI